MRALRAPRRLSQAHAMAAERPRRRAPPLYAGGIPPRARRAARQLRQASGRRNLGAAALASLGWQAESSWIMVQSGAPASLESLPTRMDIRDGFTGSIGNTPL